MCVLEEVSCFIYFRMTCVASWNAGRFLSDDCYFRQLKNSYLFLLLGSVLQTILNAGCVGDVTLVGNTAY
jgi:hypothetical protein